MFMEVAIGAVGVAVVLLVGYLLIGQIQSSFVGLGVNNTNLTKGFRSTQNIVFAGFGLLGIGILVLAAFAIVNIFK